jgi:hypothetical protein
VFTNGLRLLFHNSCVDMCRDIRNVLTRVTASHVTFKLRIDLRLRLTSLDVGCIRVRTFTPGTASHGRPGHDASNAPYWIEPTVTSSTASIRVTVV